MIRITLTQTYTASRELSKDEQRQLAAAVERAALEFLCAATGHARPALPLPVVAHQAGPGALILTADAARVVAVTGIATE
jgi:hypothetical protein